MAAESVERHDSIVNVEARAQLHVQRNELHRYTDTIISKEFTENVTLKFTRYLEGTTKAL